MCTFSEHDQSQNYRSSYRKLIFGADGQTQIKTGLPTLFWDAAGWDTLCVGKALPRRPKIGLRFLPSAEKFCVHQVEKYILFTRRFGGRLAILRSPDGPWLHGHEMS